MHTPTYTGQPLRNLTQFVNNYKTLVSEVVKRNCSRDHFIVDFINEPDATGFLWDVRLFGLLYSCMVLVVLLLVMQTSACREANLSLSRISNPPTYKLPQHRAPKT